ncbi:DUF3575 domain-containing protein [Zobellia alginiliquefaciens]|uniref:DUF3575 domain-containing protein n=1 Tax=Zobellia alginiliquefaciens TaxID=3032586 RepID=UPI0023E413E9|nr:DUF3575 domain-containing protein [Zobellia alginiliquefaciens]
MKNILCFVLFSFGFLQSGSAQDDEPPQIFRNQFSTNLVLPIVQSFDMSYERTVANKWAVGVSSAVYGDDIKELDTDNSSYNRTTNFEIMPFVRLYLNGTQTKSHFFEIFGSISEVDETGRYVRTINDQGYGVYAIGTKTYTVGGLGTGYGYRFLFVKNRLVVEAQLGIRTNFSTNYIFLNVAFVRTGIRIGYRF